jgi:hypothetical protein
MDENNNDFIPKQQHTGRKPSFRSVIQGEKPWFSFLENPHRERKAPQIVNSQLEVLGI